MMSEHYLHYFFSNYSFEMVKVGFEKYPSVFEKL